LGLHLNGFGLRRRDTSVIPGACAKGNSNADKHSLAVPLSKSSSVSRGGDRQFGVGALLGAD